ncbi:MAG: hypothetical protein H0U27_10255 [Nitrosopumilus sp.]|nr:hypothetical protein [Nitrosopumilus sp.]
MIRKAVFKSFSPTFLIFVSSEENENIMEDLIANFTDQLREALETGGKAQFFVIVSVPHSHYPFPSK